FYPTQLAINQGYNQVIWTDDTEHEFIEEAGAMNIFIRINDTLLTAPTSDRILDGITRKSILQLAEINGISVDIRNVSVKDAVEAAKDGTLEDLFGAVTSVVCSLISGGVYQDKDNALLELENCYTSRLKKLIPDIQYKLSEEKFGWRVPV